MAQRNQSAGVHFGRAKTNSLALVGIGFVFVVAVLSGVAYNAHDQAVNRAAQKASQTKATESSAQQESLDETSIGGQMQQKEETMPEQQSSSEQSGTTSSPKSSNTSSTSATVTVNGNTTTVKGSGSLKKSIISEDGRTKVNISIKNSQSSD